MQTLSHLSPVIRGLSIAVCCMGVAQVSAKETEQKPNIVLIVSDDAGYDDFSFQGSGDVKTPHIDKLAASGVHYTNAYVSSSVCSPSRAGFLTGRYQQRFGHEENLGGNYSNTPKYLFGMPVKEKTIAQLLKKQGYYTGLVGKWHLGTAVQFHPLTRGFDEFWGYTHGGHQYFITDASRKARYFWPIECNYKDQGELTYLTDDKGNEACDFIRRNKHHPFFLYLAFNAPHIPMQAHETYIEEAIPHYATKKRAILAAMTRSLDENVGKVTSVIKELGLEKNTLVIFTNDNGGGAGAVNASSNGKLSGSKSTFLEGGIRVPLITSWKGVIPAGGKYAHPVTSLDILPTAVAAAGGELDKDIHYDGVDLMPYIKGKKKTIPHDILFWRMVYSGAVRKGDWKLHWFEDREPILFNLKDDISERTNLSKKNPAKTKELLKDFNNWQSELAKPVFRLPPRAKETMYKYYDLGLSHSFVDENLVPVKK
jgi:arylsulfatase A-like enzyme